EWDCAAELPVAEEWRQHQRGDRRSVDNARDDDKRQRLNLSGSGEQLGWRGNEQRSDADRQLGRGGTDDYDATCQPDGDRRTDSELCDNGKWDCAAELSVAEEWRQHQR